MTKSEITSLPLEGDSGELCDEESAIAGLAGSVALGVKCLPALIDRPAENLVSYK